MRTPVWRIPRGACIASTAVGGGMSRGGRFTKSRACRLERFGAEQEEFTNFYEQTRLWSPFNYELSVRINRRDSVVGPRLAMRYRSTATEA